MDFWNLCLVVMMTALASSVSTALYQNLITNKKVAITEATKYALMGVLSVATFICTSSLMISIYIYVLCSGSHEYRLIVASVSGLMGTAIQYLIIAICDRD